MGWDRHGERRHYYHSVRHGGRVTKVYFGAGPAGKLAAVADVRRPRGCTAGRPSPPAGSARCPRARRQG